MAESIGLQANKGERQRLSVNKEVLKLIRVYVCQRPVGRGTKRISEYEQSSYSE